DYRRVVVADDATAVERAAADELAHYVGRIVDGKLEIWPWAKYAAAKENGGLEGLNFFVGIEVAEKVLDQPLGSWKDEEWLLRSVPAGLVLAGKDGTGDPWSIRTSAGSMLATYVLLDDYLGVHWFWPGPFGEHVPRNADAVVPELSVRATPAFAIRSVSLGYSAYHTPAFNDAMRK